MKSVSVEVKAARFRSVRRYRAELGDVETCSHRVGLTMRSAASRYGRVGSTDWDSPRDLVDVFQLHGGNLIGTPVADLKIL
jgi:hypothetical protein